MSSWLSLAHPTAHSPKESPEVSGMDSVEIHLLGIIRLADRFSDERVEAASARALKCNAISYQSVKSILHKGSDRGR